MFAVAYCDRAGVIGIVEDEAVIPHGVIVFAGGEKETIEDAVNAKARHGYTDGVLLIPGVPEAADTEEALSAFERWHAWAFPNEVWYHHLTEEGVLS
ncbi:hypothetical protein FS800_23300 [Agrobacterium vitis]|uniref:hypothetical protein n=1 Tax=Allorhizobium ampelinum TaxID=3025782 RepID=UPI001F247833|nr:hypothetical protein [Allorhizobium ampelinum]MCF1485059.1 hypothetical protein [Allorhizobium ampelinum]